MELELIEEEIPKIHRQGGTGREAEKWEDHLAALKSQPNKSFRVWTYNVRTSAVSRMSTVRDRLTNVTPEDNWEIKVRPVPDSDSAYGVYVAYRGTFTDAEQAENAAKRAQRSERTRKAREAAASAAPVPTATESENGATAATQTPQTAKEKVAAARAAKK